MKHCTNSSFTAIFAKNLVETISMKFCIIRIKAYVWKEACCFIGIKCFNKVMLISFCLSSSFMDNVDVWTVNSVLGKRNISKQANFSKKRNFKLQWWTDYSLERRLRRRPITPYFPMPGKFWTVAPKHLKSHIENTE